MKHELYHPARCFLAGINLIISMKQAIFQNSFKVTCGCKVKSWSLHRYAQHRTKHGNSEQLKQCRQLSTGWISIQNETFNGKISRETWEFQQFAEMHRWQVLHKTATEDSKIPSPFKGQPRLTWIDNNKSIFHQRFSQQWPTTQHSWAL